MVVVKFLRGNEYPFKHKYNTLNNSGSFLNCRTAVPDDKNNSKLYWNEVIQAKGTRIEETRKNNRVPFQEIH